MFLILLCDSLGSTENESNALMPTGFSYNFNSYTNLFYQVGKDLYVFGKSSSFTLKFGRGFLNAWLRWEMLYSPQDYFPDGLDQFLAFRRILDCRLLLGWFWRGIALSKYFSAFFCESLVYRKRFLDARNNVFEVWEYTSIVYAPTPSFFLRKKTDELFLRRVGMIVNPGRLKTTTNWWWLEICWFYENF